jgi:hypothetical protein
LESHDALQGNDEPGLFRGSPASVLSVWTVLLLVQDQQDASFFMYFDLVSPETWDLKPLLTFFVHVKATKIKKP